MATPQGGQEAPATTPETSTADTASPELQRAQKRLRARAEAKRKARTASTDGGSRPSLLDATRQG